MQSSRLSKDKSGAKDFRPEHSQPWLGRPFVLGEESISWGRYVVTFSAAPIATSIKRTYFESMIKHTDPTQLASEFKHLTHIYCPGTFTDFLRETQALAAYRCAKEHLKGLLCGGCTPDDYYQASVTTVGAFDEALSAVFESSIPLHGLSRLTYVRYRQKLHGMHLTIFSDGEQTYDVAFTSELMLGSIRLESDWRCIWPQST